MDLQASSLDKAALQAAGKKQVLKREWNFFAVLGMSATSLSTWEGVCAFFAAAWLNGGPASVAYGFIVSVIGFLAVTASLAEMASISPIAGAQYHWTAEHAPPRARPMLSWIQGWVTLLGWQATVVTLCFLVASATQGLIVFNDPNYTPERWHATLMTIATVGLAAIVNTAGKKHLPLISTFGGVLHM